ncbi:MAG TPA: hypothetical protein VI542_10050 [Candidatus Tectomicrobia bacterium]
MTTTEQRTVFALHTIVRVGNDGMLRGQILAICIRATGITYEVAWWDGATRRTAWLTSAEVSADDASTTTTLGAYL